MRRKALLIANTNGLIGTKADLDKFSLFLQSNTGGAWHSSEICKPLYNPSYLFLIEALQNMKSSKYDYVIVLFSGHGGQVRETILEINGNEESINESYLKGIATRQLTIFDCCRVIINRTLHDSILSKSIMNFSSSNNIRDLIRMKYNERIMQSIEQQATLYSCSIGQSSYDTNRGAVYLNHLLESAKNNHDREFLTVGVAHQQTIQPTYENILNMKNGPQTPDASLPKCLSAQQLILSINPSWYLN